MCYMSYVCYHIGVEIVVGEKSWWGKKLEGKKVGMEKNKVEKKVGRKKSVGKPVERRRVRCNFFRD
jgi:hypothetical protein